jgi:GTP-binding protein
MVAQDGLFIDYVKLRLKAGNGGNGIASFRREKYVPFGGPDGGDGGNGGSIILRVNPGLNTLEKIHSQPFYNAENGQHGGTSNKTGASADHVYLEVPKGTVVTNFDTGEVIVDMEATDGEAVVAQGGHGGKGNAKFATSTNQAPRKFTYGKEGEEIIAVFELKVVADIGLVGLPNAGKSTLISSITGAKPRIANYPFTTLQPVLGTINLPDDRSFIIADIPGIIHGASEGIGLGLDFLRHIERTKLLVYVIELSPHDPALPAQTYLDLQHELRSYDETLLNRPSFIVLNKVDLLEDEDDLTLIVDTFYQECPNEDRNKIKIISAQEKQGTESFRQDLIEAFIHEFPFQKEENDSNDGRPNKTYNPLQAE